MLGERDYMRRQKNDSDSGRGCLAGLIGANIAVYILAQLFPGMYEMLDFNALWYEEPWRLVTSLFMHSPIGASEGIFHILFNMFALYVFGSLSAPILGKNKFLWLYLVSGMTGNLCWFFAFSETLQGLVGASGAIMGVIIATAMLQPNTQMYVLFFPFPIKLKTLAIVFVLLELAQSYFASEMSSIAYMAHIGGFLGGFIFMEIFCKKLLSWDPLSKKKIPAQNWTVSDYHPQEKQNFSGNELNRILDKLSRSGINSLTPQEEDFLRKAREEMMKK